MTDSDHKNISSKRNQVRMKAEHMIVRAFTTSSDIHSLQDEPWFSHLRFQYIAAGLLANLGQEHETSPDAAQSWCRRTREKWQESTASTARKRTCDGPMAISGTDG